MDERAAVFMCGICGHSLYVHPPHSLLQGSEQSIPCLDCHGGMCEAGDMVTANGNGRH